LGVHDAVDVTAEGETDASSETSPRMTAMVVLGQVFILSNVDCIVCSWSFVVPDVAEIHSCAEPFSGVCLDYCLEEEVGGKLGDCFVEGGYHGGV
jgi:hypothetical protein